MSKRFTLPTRRGFGRAYWHLLAWIGWTCLVLGVSAMSMTGLHSGSLASVSFPWPIAPADQDTSNRYGHIDHAPLMSSTTAAEPDPGPAAIGNYDR